MRITYQNLIVVHVLDLLGCEVRRPRTELAIVLGRHSAWKHLLTVNIYWLSGYLSDIVVQRLSCLTVVASSMIQLRLLLNVLDLLQTLSFRPCFARRRLLLRSRQSVTGAIGAAIPIKHTPLDFLHFIAHLFIK